MDQEKITKSIKENKGILRQLTSLNNEVKELKELRERVKKLELWKKEILSSVKMFERRGFEIISGKDIPEQIANIKVGGTD